MEVPTIIFYMVTYSAFFFLLGIISTVIFGKREAIGELVIVDTSEDEQYMFLRIDKAKQEKLRDPFVKLKVIHEKYDPQKPQSL